MKYSESLKKNRDFQLVYKQGTSFANRFLVMYVKKNQLGRNVVAVRTGYGGEAKSGKGTRNFAGNVIQ